MKVIVINGAGGVGKDKVVEFFTQLNGINYTLNISTVDRIKDIARELGWNGQKDEESRRALSDLKDMATKWADLPLTDIKIKIESFYNDLVEYGIDHQGVVFVHCREPQEIERIVHELPYFVYTLLIRRPSVEHHYGNHADDDVLNYNYDFTIINDGTLEDLEEKVKQFYINIIKRRIDN